VDTKKNEEKQKMIDENRRMKDFEDIYKTLVESSKDGVVVIQDGIIIFVNIEMVKMTGFSLEESIGKPFITFITPEYRDIVAKNYMNRMKGKSVPERYDLAFITSSGGTVEVEVNASLIEYHGKPADMAIIRDQTERKKLENSLRERDEFLNNIIEQTPNPIWISDIEGNVIKINKALKDLLKVTEEEIIGKYNVMKDTQVIEQGHLGLVKSVFEEGKTVGFTIDYYTEKEKQVKPKDKSHIVFEITMSPLKNSEGKIVNVLSQQKDITQRVLAEQALQASEEKYRSLFNYSTDAIIMSVPDGRVLSANPAACKLLGATEKEICEGGRNSVVDVTDPRLKQALAERERNGYFRGELKCIRKDGSKFDSELTSAIFKDNEGNLKTWIILRDITEFKNIVESLRLFYAALKSIHDCVIASDNEFRIFYWNETCETVFGIKASDAVGKYIDDVIQIVEDHQGHNRDRVKLLQERGYDRDEQQYQTPRGTIWVDVRAQAIEQDGKRSGWITIASDVTERKQAEKRQQLMVDILHLLNKARKRTEILENIIHLIKQFSGVEAVGIRLKEGDDYPYVYHSGYVDGHIEAENHLCLYKDDGSLLRDNSGNPVLDCMCGNIIQSRFDPEKPYFTRNGSFWTNSISELLGSIGKKDRQSWTRKRCAIEGYESAALIPVRSDNEIIGLFQLNDSRKHMFTPDIIEFIENVGSSIGIAFSRSMAQEKLEHEKNRVESIINTAQTIILTLDKEGNILDFNPYMEELSGYKIEEVRGKNWFETFLPERDKKQVLNLFKTSINVINLKGNTNPILTRDGRELQILWYGTLTKDNDGNISGLLATGQDVTERIQLEELNNVITTKTPIGIYIVQEKWIVYINPEFQKITGYSDDDLKKMGAEDLIYPDDREFVRKESIAMLKGQRNTPFEFRVQDPNGKIRWALETVISITYGGRRASLGCFMDITENKLAEQAVNQSEIKLRTIIESIPQGIIVTDMKGNILQVNLSAIKLYDCKTENEIIGKNALDFALTEYHDRILGEIRKAQETNSQVKFLYSAMTVHRRNFPAEMSIIHIMNTYGEPAGIIGVFEDITERTKLQEQLVMTDRLASVGELAAGIAHELNNPLTGVVGFSDLLLTRTDISEDIRADLEVINREAIRASQVAKHLLTFARRHPDEKAPTDINSIIRIAMELRAYEQRVNNIRLITNLDTNLPKVLANDFQLQQVFINIIINAEYFMVEEHGKGNLTITTEHTGDIIRIVFQDDGPGIPHENLINIFNPFFTTKVVGKGTGLGLSICYGIITEHNGKIYAESTPGEGARFIIELPVYNVKR
jgi:PAS domain S-box-containing protein